MTGPRMRLLLIVSLVLNAFLSSAGVAVAWRWHHIVGLGLPGGWRARAAEVLTPEQRESFRAAMRETVVAARPLAREGRQARAEAARLFALPSFDATAAKAALARARTADVTLRGRIEDRVVDVAATMTPDERATFVQALRRGPLRQPQRKRAAAGDGSQLAAR